MATFESKVSEIFDENPRLTRKIPVVIRQIFQESEFEFKRRLRNASDDTEQSALLRLFDILFIDFYFDELNGRFLNWVIDNYPERFSKAELDEMQAQSLSHLDFYEVQKVLPGKGSFIKSLFTDNEGFLKDVASSSNLVKWDIILARCYHFHGNYYATGSLALFSPDYKIYILNRISEAKSENSTLSQNSEYADFAKNRWDIFFQIERDIKEKEKNKKFYTKYGELQFCEVRFQVRDIQSVLNKIKIRDEFNFIETKTRRDKKKKRNITRYEFEWFTLGIEKELESIKTSDFDDGVMLTSSQLDEEGNPMDIEVLGSLYVDKYLCRLEIRSLEVAEFAVNHFAKLFSDALTFKRIIKKKTDLSREHEISEEPIKSGQFTTQLSPDLVKQYMENYYLSLLDEKIPAFNNLSPREARKNPATMPMLIEWLKGLENMFERQGEQPELIRKIKQELNIDW